MYTIYIVSVDVVQQVTLGVAGVAWWLIGKVDAYHPKGRGFDSRFSLQIRDLGQVLRSQLPVALRRETSTQYPSCVGSASE